MDNIYHASIVLLIGFNSYILSV